MFGFLKKYKYGSLAHRSIFQFSLGSLAAFISMQFDLRSNSTLSTIYIAQIISVVLSLIAYFRVRAAVNRKNDQSEVVWSGEKHGLAKGETKKSTVKTYDLDQASYKMKLICLNTGIVFLLASKFFLPQGILFYSLYLIYSLTTDPLIKIHLLNNEAGSNAQLVRPFDGPRPIYYDSNINVSFIIDKDNLDSTLKSLVGPSKSKKKSSQRGDQQVALLKGCSVALVHYHYLWDDYVEHDAYWIEHYAKKYKSVAILAVDGDDCPDILAEKRFAKFPVLEFYTEGPELKDTHYAIEPKDLESTLDRLVIESCG